MHSIRGDTEAKLRRELGKPQTEPGSPVLAKGGSFNNKSFTRKSTKDTDGTTFGRASEPRDFTTKGNSSMISTSFDNFASSNGALTRKSSTNY